jgi:hypothetical protein
MEERGQLLIQAEKLKENKSNQIYLLSFSYNDLNVTVKVSFK